MMKNKMQERRERGLYYYYMAQLDLSLCCEPPVTKYIS